MNSDGPFLAAGIAALGLVTTFVAISTVLIAGMLSIGVNFVFGPGTAQNWHTAILVAAVVFGLVHVLLNLSVEGQ